MAATKTKHRVSLSIDRRSTLSDQRKVSNNSFSSKGKSFSDKPTPTDFDLFLPWICKEMQVPNSVIVLTMAQEKYPKASCGSASSKSKSSIKTNRTFKLKHDDFSSNKKLSVTTATSGVKNVNYVPITAYYDTSGRLVEIAIIGCTVDIPKQVIQAISFCFPFHSLFAKLEIRKGGLHSALLNEIGKMLPYSNLVDVCLDDTRVPQGNYYVLLDKASHLKHLSVSKCNITDEICKKIFSRLKFGCPAEKSVMILNLSMNRITDDGANFIGDVLRGNRNMLHLNLAGNNITDIGLGNILRSLLEFPLTYDEIIESKTRYLKYCKNRLYVYNKCLEEVTEMTRTEELLAKHDGSPSKHTKFRDRKKEERRKTIVETESVVSKAEKLTNKMLGEFYDPFCANNVIKRNNYLYSIGNLKLCSLNLSYNKLEFISLVKILKVLCYQNSLTMKPPNTGLMHIVLEGNLLPQSCRELDSIKMFLSNVVKARAPVHLRSPTMKKRTSN
ncbi:hypothetical protein evm_006027 [Chilo suppressalis]|nr:hypothetical protein evm_006027 [Chilo suppressalis]